MHCIHQHGPSASSLPAPLLSQSLSLFLSRLSLSSKRAVDHDCLGLVRFPSSLRPPPAAAELSAAAAARPSTPLQSMNSGFFGVLEVPESNNANIKSCTTMITSTSKSGSYPTQISSSPLPSCPDVFSLHPPPPPSAAAFAAVDRVVAFVKLKTMIAA